MRVTEAAGDGTRVLFDNDSREQEVVLRSNWRYRPRPGTALAWGVTARRLFGDFDLFDGPDRTRLDTRDEPLDVRAALTGHKAGAFVSVEQSLYHRLDLRFDSRRHYRNVTLVSFFTVLNVYNRDNVFHYYWDADDNRPRRATQWGFLPVGGFELEF